MPLMYQVTCTLQFTSLQKEIDDHKEEIKKYQAETQKLNSVIRNLEKDIAGLKKEIQERDETIQDKVNENAQSRCSYYLKLHHPVIGFLRAYVK